ncbi:MAG: baseplate protein [Bacteroidota bacterium]|nr:baseplate protein [Bacteroidota bacterium]
MQLPVIETPTYKVVMPSTKKEIEMRPFLVKEEKVLMIAQESGDTQQILTAMKKIIRACSFDKIVPNDLTTYDLEYVFMQLRARSVGETSKLIFKCEKCGKEHTAIIDISKIEVQYPEKEPKSKIEITDKVGMQLKPMSLRNMADLSEDSTDADISAALASIVDYIYDEEQVYNSEDIPKNELNGFIDNLSHKHLELMQEFMENQPKLSYTYEWICEDDNCKHKNKIVLEGIRSFFT